MWAASLSRSFGVKVILHTELLFISCFLFTLLHGHVGLMLFFMNSAVTTTITYKNPVAMKSSKKIKNFKKHQFHAKQTMSTILHHYALKATVCYNFIVTENSIKEHSSYVFLSKR